MQRRHTHVHSGYTNMRSIQIFNAQRCKICICYIAYFERTICNIHISKLNNAYTYWLQCRVIFVYRFCTNRVVCRTVYRFVYRFVSRWCCKQKYLCSCPNRIYIYKNPSWMKWSPHKGFNHCAWERWACARLPLAVERQNRQAAMSRRSVVGLP